MTIKPPAFIMIPYQLLADERVKPLEEKLYGFIYWFTKLKNEQCTASNEVFAQLAKTTPGVIKNSLTNLEKRGYIKRTFKDRNRRIRSEIIPLIDFNVIENNTPTRPELIPGEGKILADMIDLFKAVNPSHDRLFGNKTEREAMERMF